MNTIDTYKKALLNQLNAKIYIKEPSNLYEPIHYILQLGGKRLRPILTLLTCDIFSDNYQQALDAAVAVEVFHNFTLIHDDIMDSASVRRGKVTVHKKWSVNTGILSGDAMMIMAYTCFDSYEPSTHKKLLTLFNTTALEVCEGQQLDVDFETRTNVSIIDYIKMITLKTSVLVAAAMKMGAIIANVDEKQSEAIYNFGLNLGIAFQLQDDYLDTFGDFETFGKNIGGDIIENKKTFLFLKCIEVANETDKNELLKLYTSKSNDFKKVKDVTNIFIKNNIANYTVQEIEKYTNNAFLALNSLSISDDKKSILKSFGVNLMKRTV